MKEQDITICNLCICNAGKEDISNLTLDINIPQGSVFVSGHIERERGILEIEEGLKNLILGNIRHNEKVNILIKIMDTKKEIL